MGLQTVEKKRTQRRVLRVRNKINRGEHKPRVSVFRSLKNVYVQLIDDAVGKTLVGMSSLKLDAAQKDKTAVAFAMGKEFAQQVKKLGIESVAFDRGRFRYHGRVKALVDGLREGGLKV